MIGSILTLSNPHIGEMIMRCSLAVLILATALLGTLTQAEEKLLTPADLERYSEHIVTGNVRYVYTTEKVLGKTHVDTLFAVEVVVTGAEKGKGIAADQVIFVRTWEVKKRDDPCMISVSSISGWKCHCSPAPWIRRFFFPPRHSATSLRLSSQVSRRNDCLERISTRSENTDICCQPFASGLGWMRQ